MSIVNKIFICLCCSETSCAFASCYDEWASTQACALGCLNCWGCCWTICAPICHTCSIGDFSKGVSQLVKGAKFCLYGCAVSIIAPIDGCINCILYNKKNFESGVSGVNDIVENSKFIAKKIESAFEIKGSNEPDTTFRSFTP